MKINRDLRWALVLSGGGARGLVHVGALCALHEAGYPPPALVVGASMGAIIGGLYAAGMSERELKSYVLDKLDIAAVLESPVFRIEGPIGKLFQTGQILGNIASKSGIDSGKKILKIFEELSGEKNFEDCSIKFLCNAVDLCTGREVVFHSGSVAKAMRASMSFPFLFEPLVDGDFCYIDGGVADNLPVRFAREYSASLGISRVLAVDTRRWRVLPPHSFKNGTQVVMRCFDALIHVSETEESAGRADLLIHAVDKSSPFDFSRKKELVALGEAAVRQSAAELGAFFGSGVKAAFARRGLSSCGIHIDAFWGGQCA
ncbi:MAG: patatin-like phospholipase family protein [Treponema sp.]|jgi:NTE family protein|nr:patatin-like phospholipase family protein [Treponema sp.]